MRTPLAGLLLVAIVLACQSLPEGGGGSRPRSDRITRAELEELPTFTARQAIQKLRPSWLRPRTSTIRGGSGTRHTATVFLDGMARGGLSALDGMDIREIEEIRFISASDATTRYGTGYPGGIIEVFTRRG